MAVWDDLDPARPILIAGATASGKSALAMHLAETQGGVVVNADAIQIYANWRVLTARPSGADEARVPHHLYGHVAGDQPYSAGDWLRAVIPLLSAADRPIIVGGTGLYFSALTEGLAEIPLTPPEIRQAATERLETQGLTALLDDLDGETRGRIDTQNPMRVQRAWEVLQTTGAGLAVWQDQTPPPALPLADCVSFVVSWPTEVLNARIAMRFDAMVREGALEEARRNLDGWSDTMPSAKAIGAKELIAHLQGKIPLEEAKAKATIATRQFAKRQRTWFRARMQGWTPINGEEISL